ncbi:hypothetical protein Esti_006640 [Eimeria stiedai]
MTEALGKAVLRGDAEAVRRHLEEGADPSAFIKKGSKQNQAAAAAAAGGTAAAAAEEGLCARGCIL